jgi:hypothetical protein
MSAGACRHGGTSNAKQSREAAEDDGLGGLDSSLEGGICVRATTTTTTTTTCGGHGIDTGFGSPPPARLRRIGPPSNWYNIDDVTEPGVELGRRHTPTDTANKRAAFLVRKRPGL